MVSRVKERVAEINAKGMLPDGLKIVAYYDRSELVDAALWTVTKVLLEGIVLVVVVLFLFLGDVRSSLIVVATLVLTPLVTFMVMNQLRHLGQPDVAGRSGDRHRPDGRRLGGGGRERLRAARRQAQAGESRVAGDPAMRWWRSATPVIFGVGIIILVFLPLMTLQGMEGKMFAPLAYTIAIALAHLAGAVADAVAGAVPPTCSRAAREHDTRFDRACMKRALPAHAATGRSRNEKKTVAGGRRRCSPATLALFPFLGTSFIPEMKEGSISPSIDRVPNISLDESIKMEMEAMRLVMQVPGVQVAVSGSAAANRRPIPPGPTSPTPIVSLKPRNEWPTGWTQDDIAEDIREKLKAPARACRSSWRSRSPTAWTRW